MTEFLEELDRCGDFTDILFIGDGIDTCSDIIEQWDDGKRSIAFAKKESRYQDASTVALRGRQLFADGKILKYPELEPEYLRMAEAEKKLKEKQSNELR